MWFFSSYLFPIDNYPIYNFLPVANFVKLLKVESVNENLFALGLFVFGFTLLFLMPASMRNNWRELGSKPVAGDVVLLMMRFLGIVIIAAGVLILAGQK
jgi:hypothetical protein